MSLVFHLITWIIDRFNLLINGFNGCVLSVLWKVSKRSLYRLLSLLILFSLVSCAVRHHYSGRQLAGLRSEAARLVMVGFRGVEELPEELVYDLKDLKVGGVILFEYDAPSKSRPRNIVSPMQVRSLIARIKKEAGYKLLIAVDQEGGKVNRLKKGLGFPWIPSAEYIGEVNQPDTTLKYAQLMTQTLIQAGFNVNFAPCVDVNVNSLCPVIGGVQRSFSADPKEVVKHASVFVKTMDENGILPVLKHFPGHGSAKTDTHEGFTDITATWVPEELDPYRLLMKQSNQFAIMTAHVFHRKYDTVYPATLSRPFVTDLLKKKLGYKGVVFSDDMMMGAITKNYDLATSIELALNAGVDMLVFSNNIENYDPEIARKVVETIVDLVERGRVSRKRIHEASQKVKRLTDWVN